MTAKQRGTLFVFLAAVLYSIGGLCIKLIPWGGMAINGGRTAIALVVIGTYMILTKKKLKFNRWVAIGAVAVCGTNILFSLANKMTTAANAIVLQFTAPVFAILIALLIFKKRPKTLEILTCMAVFVGILFFFWDSLSAGGMLGNVLAILSGLTYAGVFFLNDLLEGDSISAVFWGDACSALVGLPFLLQETDFSLQPMVCLILLGVFQVGLAYICLTIGLATVPPVTASLVSGIEPVLNPILVALFYHETVGVFAMIGSVIVVGSVVIYNVILSGQIEVSCR